LNLLIAAFVVCALVMAAMAVGVIVSNIRIKGTCGGLGAMKDEIGQPMCECGAREGEACGQKEGDNDGPDTEGRPPVYRSRADAAKELAV